MNKEQLVEILTEAGFDYTPDTVSKLDNFNKFAELIEARHFSAGYVDGHSDGTIETVRRCAAYMYENYPNSRYEVNYMRKHMGDPDWNRTIEASD